MIASRRFGLGALTVVALCGPAQVLQAQEYRTTTASRQRRGEENLAVHVQFGIGNFRVRPAPERILYRMSLRYDARVFQPVADYDADGRELRVGIEGVDVRASRVNYREMPEQRLDLELSPAVETDLELAFGAGTADVELGGLSLRRIELKGGATQATVRFSQPNRISCDRLRLEVGAIDLTTERLGNARCRRIELKGAAGDIILDLTGEWGSDPAQVEIEVGLGSVRVRLPQGLGVAVRMDRFLTSFDQAGLQRRGDRYYSADYERAAKKIELDIKSAIGNVDIEWVR